MADAVRSPAARRGVSLEFARYLLAGVANTAVGYAVFLALIWGAGVGPLPANAVSYAVGLLVSLLLNRFFVFQGATVTPAAVARFVGGFGVSYALNLVTLSLLLAMAVPPAAAQLFAMAVYTVSFYAINRGWVWRRSVSGAIGRRH